MHQAFGPYAAADPTLEAWGREHSVPWLRVYRDDEVRSAEFTLPGGIRAQLWLEPVAGSEAFAVCAWDCKRNRFREETELGDLASTLTRALATLRTWARPSGDKPA